MKLGIDKLPRMKSIRMKDYRKQDDKHHSEDGSNNFNRNIGKDLPGYRMLQPIEITI
jgi:hypothetical protein